MRTLNWIALVLAAAAPTSGAQTLNLRTGTWEMTTQTTVRGMPVPRATLEQMSPPQRAELDAALREQSAAGRQTEVSRACIAEEDLQRPLRTAPMQACTQQVVKANAGLLETRLACSGEFPTTGRLRIRAPAPDRLDAVLELNAGDSEDPFVLRSEISGRWLEAVCEDEDAYDEDDAEDTSDPKDFDEPEDEL